MKNYMLPKGSGILREINTQEQQLSSPNPKQRSRKKASSRENVSPSDLNSMVDYSSPSVTTAKTLSSVGKMKSPLPPRPPSSNPLKRKLILESVPENSAPGSFDSGVQVIVRMRPPNPNVDADDLLIVEKASSESLSVLGQTFTFDSVADTGSSQKDIYQLVGAPLVENCLAGFNSSIFAYGQTGSGKTYTMWGPSNALLEDNPSGGEQGLTPRVFEQLFSRMSEEEAKHADKQLKYQCRCSFLEIYNEQITDLLDPSQRNLLIREDVKSGVYVENLSEQDVCTMKDVRLLLIKGLANRRTGATSINAESSRSHSVFTCTVESRCKSMSDGLSSCKTSRINLVDLAGSERQKLTGAAGERLKEAGNINRSLSQLGNLINILADVSQTGKQRHIPYRDSRLTFLLQESLGGNARLAMICAISPVLSCKNETLSTLRFAQRAKAIKNKATVNEVMQDDVNVLREVIRQLKDELLRMKANANPAAAGPNGGYSTSWSARRSLSILKMSLNQPMTLPHIDDDSDEEMEIDEEAVERLCNEVENNINEREVASENAEVKALSSDDPISAPVSKQGLDVADVNMEVCPLEGTTEEEAVKNGMVIYDQVKDVKDPIEEQLQEGGPTCETLVENHSADASVSKTSVSCSPSAALPSNLSVISCEATPVLHSPPLSVSPRVNESSRKSLKTLSMLSASQKDLAEEKNLGLEDLRRKSVKCKSSCVQTSTNGFTQTEHLAASLHRGLQIIDSHRQSTAFGRSSFRFSYKPAELKPLLLSVDKVDVGVQTVSLESEVPVEDASDFLCSNCKNRTPLLELKEETENSNMQLVPIEVSHSGEKTKKLVPKAVERVLAGAIRREMALEEFCAKQTAEISQLDRLVQQYKHERECNSIIEQTREDKIRRLESLMDGVLPTEEFMEEEFLSLANEHKLLKEKYDNHPELLRTKIELRRVQDELDSYRNFFDMGERDVLVEEVQHLRSQLTYYVDSSSSPLPSRKRSPMLQLTYPCEPPSTPLCAIPETTERSMEEKFEQERCNWTEAEGKWISLCEELRTELEESRVLAEKLKVEYNSEKRCADELKEAMQMAMQGHARILEQYADLQEKHLALLARHRKMQEGIEDVKKAASKAGVRGAESKFINSLAAEISALKVDREKEKRYMMDEKKGLQAQLRDTAEAVQAAGELVVRLKEAEEVAFISQKRALEAEQESEKAYRQIQKLKKKHEKEISTLNQVVAESRLPKESIRPAHYDFDTTRYDEPLYHGQEEDTELPVEPFPWFSSGYDQCNI
ncbi:hypothetical protein MKW98_028340 [Papaver atlanticum]|uniref:Kinesin motor domain-containing protein n=1 Tax=Papaver atlanticum TaxID=357466 RepID=A0AAD4SY45_9MAGN|nr:hypothetical protein MKW98_028340 [Papaver atlanticum]